MIALAKWVRINDCTSRMKVPHGWLIRCVIGGDGGQTPSSCMCFVKDNDHDWKIIGVDGGYKAKVES